MIAMWALSSLELACGFPLGAHHDVPPLPARDSTAPLEALERAVLPALEESPCTVSFSGGRDSSTVLAVAVRAARRHGLPEPVALTLRFPASSSSEESSWQERVISHLRLRDWVRLEFGEDLGVLGPVARGVLRRHGPLWPANAHLHVPMLQQAKGGSLLTGLDGDGLFGGWRWMHLNAIRPRRLVLHPRYARRVAHWAAPSWARRPRHGVRLPWLRASAQDAYDRAWSREQRDQPRRWNAYVDWLRARRYLVGAKYSFELLGADEEVRVAHPLLDPGFLTSLGVAGGTRGWADRTTAMESLFGEVLPGAMLARNSKAVFDEVFWTGDAAHFAHDWTGRGIDPVLVDPDALRRTWLDSPPHAGSALLMQSAWLASASDDLA